MKKYFKFLIPVYVMGGLFFIFQSCSKSDKPTPVPPVTNPPPTTDNSVQFTSFEPNQGAVGSAVILKGNNFAVDKAKNEVKFNGIVAEVTEAKLAELTVKVPTGATTGKITVKVGDKTATSSADFIVDAAAPVITSFSPSTGSAGTVVEITGSNFTAETKVFFGAIEVPSADLIITTSKITAKVPTGASSGNIKVKVDTKEAVSATDFIVPGLAITSFSPATGSAGTVVEIVGVQFAADAKVFFGTAEVLASDLTITETKITAKVPAGAATGKIKVVSGGKEVISDSDFIVPGFSFTSFSPATGVAGTQVELIGTQFAAGAKVFFGTVEVASTDMTITPDKIIVKVPASAATGKIKIVSDGKEIIHANDFIVPGLAFTSFSPSSGGVGATVELTGDQFTAGTKVFFGAVEVSAADLTITTTKIMAKVPTGAITGKIKIVSGGKEIIHSATFTVPVLTLSSFTPTKGDIATVVEIVGDQFATGARVFFGATEVPTADLVITTTKITAKVPTGALSGKIKVVSDGKEVQSGVDFKVAPRITALSSSVEEGQIVTITGVNFSAIKDENTITFGTGNATSAEIVSASTSEIKVKAPAAGTDGKIKVVVDGMSSESSTDFIYLPTISDFSPKSGGVGTIVKLTGKRFDITAATTTVKINNTTATITSLLSGEIQFEVPPGIFTTSKIALTNKGATQETSSSFELTDYWTKVSNQNIFATTSYTGVSITNPAVVAYDNKLYVIMGKYVGSATTEDNKVVYIFTPPTTSGTNGVWTQGHTLPATIPGREGAKATVKDGKIYIGGGSLATGVKNFIEYNPAIGGSAAFRELADYPYAPLYLGMSFTLNVSGVSTVYAGLGGTTQLQKYDVATNTWSGFDAATEHSRQPINFVINNVAYFGGSFLQGPGFSSKFYKFDPSVSTSSVQTLATPIPSTYTPRVASFALNNKGYLLGPASAAPFITKVFVYDPVLDAWSQVRNAPDAFITGVVINNIAYGMTATGDVYQYTPNK